MYLCWTCVWKYFVNVSYEMRWKNKVIVLYCIVLYCMIKEEYVCKTLMNMTRKCHIMFYRLTPYGISLSYSLMFYRLTPFYHTIQYNTIQYNTTIINNILCMFIIQTIDCFSICPCFVCANVREDILLSSAAGLSPVSWDVQIKHNNDFLICIYTLSIARDLV